MDKAYAKQVARAILFGSAKDDTYFYKLFSSGTQSTNGVYRITKDNYDKFGSTTNAGNWTLLLEIDDNVSPQ